MMSRSFVFFWETEPGRFIFESAGERKGQLGKNLSADEICRNRAFEGTKKVFNWHTKELYPIEITHWISQRPEIFTMAKDPLTWAENSILRKFLNSKGYPGINEGGRTEKHQGDIHQAIRDIKEYLYGTPTAIDFKPKVKTTIWLLNFIVDKYNDKHSFNEVLYAATMGAGKTSDFLHACNKWQELYGTNVHLCVTSMPDTRKDLARDMRDGIQFQNTILVVPDKSLPVVQYILKHRVIRFSDFRRVGIDKSKNYIVSLGVQDARGNAGRKYKNILKKLKFGIYGKDEVHTNQGEFSIFEKKVVPNIEFGLAAYFTGTAEKLILEGTKFTPDNSLLFGANELYEAQIGGDPDWQGYPWRNFMVLDYKSAHEAVCLQLGLTSDQGWTLKKQWDWDKDNNCLTHEASVTELIKIRFGVGIYADSPSCFWGPGSGLAKYKRKTGVVQIENGHSNVKTIHVAKLIEQLTGIRSFSAHEPNGYDNWLDFCINNPDQSSVYVTHDKDMTGKNNKKINFQWLSLSIGSATRLGQSLGRGNRKDEFKDNVYYFVDDPETALSVTLDVIEATSNDPGSSKKSAEKINRIASYWFEGSERWSKATLPDMVKFIQKLDPIGLRGMNSLRHINVHAQCPLHLAGVLTKSNSPNSVSTLLSGIDAPKGKNSRPSIPADDPASEISKSMDNNKLYRQNLRTSVRGLAKALIRTEGQYSDVTSILSNPVIIAEGIEVALEKICSIPMSFADLRSAFDIGDANESSVNKCLSVVLAKLEESNTSVESKIEFLGIADLVDNSVKYITESVDLVTDYIYNVRMIVYKNRPNLDPANATIADLYAGRGAFLIKYMRQEPLTNPNNVFYNDINPVTVHSFRLLNQRFNLGIPDTNITCGDALTYKERTTMEFDLGVGNPAFNVSEKETGNGTGGNVNLYKQGSDAMPIKKGGTKALITPKGMIRYLKKDKDFDTHLVNYMTEKDYWSYNTCYWIGTVQSNSNSMKIADKVISKIITLDGNPNWYELNGDVNKNKINYSGPGGISAIVELQTKKTPAVRSIIDPNWGKVAHGPKFCATLFENKATYLVTDEPLCARFSGAYLTSTLDEAKKIRLFVENNKLLRALNKRLKFKGLFWTMRHVKSFDPNQINTGHEVPKEWNLTTEDLKYLGL